MKVLRTLLGVIVLTLVLGTVSSGAPGFDPWREGDEVPPAFLADARSLSAGQMLDLDFDRHLVFSNVPEMPSDPGVLCRVDNAVSPRGETRVLFSHFNMLIDWMRRPLANVPAMVGFVVVNDTGRPVEVGYLRGATGISRHVDGTLLFTGDRSPLDPDDPSTAGKYYGTEVGNRVIRDWYLSGLDGRIKPLGTMPGRGDRVWVTVPVGARGWAAGMYDLVFVDARTKQRITTHSLQPGEAIGVRTFIAYLEADLEAFYRRSDNAAAILNRAGHERWHMRGLFAGGVYASSPDGEAVSKGKRLSYNTYRDGKRGFAAAANAHDLSGHAGSPGRTKDVFINDYLRNGYDAYGRIDSLGRAHPEAGINTGSYGADYTFDLEITGPSALIVQGALDEGRRPFVDLYNQFLTAFLDDDPERLVTVQIKDQNYERYYMDFEALGPLGRGKVLYTFPQEGTSRHTLRFVLPPNAYGPVRFYLVPLAKSGRLPPRAPFTAGMVEIFR